jgi:hypothetical protein
MRDFFLFSRQVQHNVEGTKQSMNLSSTLVVRQLENHRLI